ncbi:MAG TPA: exodeoxyribonuclease VII small subunit [Methylococcaceae bacterium]|jgi:exodeoxyribonuclease VII small subunit|nr:exodeoxyribonuclease VII small subunit [Methylococcaceae bacterium]HIL39571.1 exodeoxyribonuclease VII small subunit [Methylococcales bacterium]HIA45206.1 exodeoxyribonuclease VII small subunit [Methylococcaceae bacterium]HIB61909.1 exodeoxyribonuclease VII small subunit [Methylococcaceae bacterium]HIN69241.1 exodeoxyribonuclease VII small subunit [Methylococcales bacterium]
MARKNITQFEETLAALETLVEQLEKGDLSLEESLKSFEQGVKLTRACQTALQEAEQKVQILLEKNGTEQLEKFNDE